MRCERCGAELSADGYCPSCGAEACNAEEPHVQVLSPAERNAYRGVTIEEGNPEEGGARSDIRFKRSRQGWGGFSYVSSGSWQGKLTLYLGIAALLLFVFFIAVPVALAVIVFSIVSWILYRLFL